MTGNAPSATRRERICVWCGQVFTPPGRRGPAARYCRPAHRQRALEERRLDADRAELVALRGLVSGLTGMPAPARPGQSTGRMRAAPGPSRWLLVLTGPDGTSQLLGRYASVATAGLALRRPRQTYRRVCGPCQADRLRWRVASAEEPATP